MWLKKKKVHHRDDPLVSDIFELIIHDIMLMLMEHILQNKRMSIFLHSLKASVLAPVLLSEFIICLHSTCVHPASFPVFPEFQSGKHLLLLTLFLQRAALPQFFSCSGLMPPPSAYDIYTCTVAAQNICTFWSHSELLP